MLTIQRLKEVLSYDPDTGEFRWIKAQKGVVVGEVAGCKESSGYILIRIDNSLYRAHRLAWMYLHGEFPSECIDHINRNRSDNRISNLRQASHRQNAQNRSVHSNNKSGVPGVHWDNGTRKWRAKIMLMYKSIHVGLFDSVEDAANAVAAAKKKYHTFSQESDVSFTKEKAYSRDHEV